MFYCEQCWIKLNEDTEFCVNCGTKRDKESPVNKKPLAVNTFEPIETDFFNATVKTYFDGKEILAKNSLNPFGISLYVDNKLIAKNSRFSVPLLDTLVIEEKHKFESGERTIQVYMKSGKVHEKVKICIL